MRNYYYFLIKNGQYFINFPRTVKLLCNSFQLPYLLQLLMQRSCCIPPTLLYFLRANSFKTSQPWKTMRLGSGECGKDIVTRCFKIKSSELPGLVCLLTWFGSQFPRFSKRACLALVLSVCSSVYCITLMVSCPPVARERRRVSAGYCRGRWKYVPRPRCRQPAQQELACGRGDYKGKGICS